MITNNKITVYLPILLLLAQLLLNSATAIGAEAEFDFFSDEPIAEESLVLVPPEKPAWQTIGGPIALLCFFFCTCFLVKWFMPFKQTDTQFNLHNLPIAAQRGIGVAVVLYGIALAFGAIEAHYQINMHGDAHTYFKNMSIGKLIAFTHAHLFGFTTSFFIVGIPFSLHFNSLKIYQWIFPIGLIASLTDIISWWGIKFISSNFEYITWFSGFVFSYCYIWMLIGLVRVLFFPSVRWLPDFINDRRQRIQKAKNKSN